MQKRRPYPKQSEYGIISLISTNLITMKLNPKTFGLAGGIMWGVAMLIMTLVSMSSGYAGEMMDAMTKLYPGYTVTGGGAIVGLIWGFLDAFIGLYIFAWLYNKLEAKMK